MSAIPFVLSVKAVIHDKNGHCLLIRRSAHNQHFVGCWEWPGGKLDPGESFVDAVVREAREETGLEIEVAGLAGATQFDLPEFHVVLLCMEARVTGGELRLSEEHDETRWVSSEEFCGLELVPQVREFMMAYAARNTRRQ